LWVEEAVSRLNNSDRLVVDRDSVKGVLLVLQYGHERQTQILGMHVGGEGVGHRLLCASWNLDGVLLCGEVADDTRLSGLLEGKRSADDGDANGERLIVGDGKTSFGGMAIDELDAKDLRLGEGDGDLDVQIGRLRRLIYNLFDLRTRY
jgi:hypothetical protein